MDEGLTTPNGITRRHALRVMVRGGAVLICALQGETPADAVAPWVEVGRVSDFKVGQPKRVALKAGQAAFVLRQPNGRWLAVSAVCTHKGGEVRWDSARKRFLCPLHLATFTADGGHPTAPARAPLSVFATRAKGNAILVDAAGPASPTGAGRKGTEKRERDHEREEEHG